MRLWVVAGIFLVLSIGLVSAADFSSSYEIVGSKVLVTHNFGAVEDIDVELPFDASLIEVNVEEYEILDFVDSKLLKINASDSLSVSYITGTHIDKGSGKMFFILENYFDNLRDIYIVLPEGAVLSGEGDGLVFPEGSETTTNGRNIIISWKDFDSDQALISYEFVNESIFSFELLIILIIAFGGFFVVKSFVSRKKKKKSYRDKVKGVKRAAPGSKMKKELTANLYREEKQIVEYLIGKEGKSCWTKELARDLGIPKVRLSRKLRSLQEKGLISREPHGNENRIKLISPR